MRRLELVLAAFAAVVSGQPASAAWQRASTMHFIIYANSSQKRLRDFAERLEKFDKAVRYVRSMTDPPVGDSNRVTLFVVSNQDAVARLAKDASGRTAGFYSGRASGSIAIIPQSLNDDDMAGAMTSEVVFFHEYAHHLMLSDSARPYPEWLIEGFAEFMSTALFQKDGSVGLGIAPQFRAFGLLALPQVPLERLLAGNFAKLSISDRDSFYGRSWLLTHYLNFEPTRRGQIDSYLADFDKGIVSVVAARHAFGDLKELNKALQIYLAKPRLTYVKVLPAVLSVEPVAVDALSPGAAAVMPDRIQSKVGVDKTTAEPLAVRVRAIEQRFPGDLLVLRTLAETELDSGHPAAAMAAADRALKADPRDVEAILFKGRAIEAGSDADRFTVSRRLFIAANNIDKENPEPLALFFQSYLHEGLRPNANAVAALHYASDLAPQDTGLRMNSAIQYLRDGQTAPGRAALASVAYDPHGEEAAKVAQAMLALVDAGNPAGALAMVDHKTGGVMDPKGRPPGK